MNAKIMQEKGFVEHIAKIVGREEELGKGSNIYNLSAVLGKIEDLSIDELDNVDIDLHDNVDITRLNYRGEMKRQFQTLDKPQQQLIHRIFDLTKKDMSRTNHKIQDSIHNNELDDRTNVAFGFGSRTQKFTMKDVLKQK